MPTELKGFWQHPFNTMSNDDLFFRNSPTQYGWAVDGLVFISDDGAPVNTSEVDRQFIVSTVVPGTAEPERMLLEVTLRVDEAVEPPIPVSIVNIGLGSSGDSGAEGIVAQALHQLVPSITEGEIFPANTVSGPAISVNWGVLLASGGTKTWVCVDVEEPYAEQVFNRLSKNNVSCWLVRAFGGESVAAQYDVVRQNDC